MSVITSLLLTSSVATWIAYPFNFIMLALDGIVYSLVAYSYRIFMLMAQLNFNVIYAWVSPLIDRIKAVILVVIMFKLGMSFIQYMVTPEKFDDAKVGGPALIKNIFISAVLLVSYSLIFSVMNELSLLIIGVPEGYTFTTLNDLAGVENTEETDNGLLARFIFGKDSDSIEDFGKNLSVMTLSVFLHSSTGDASAAEKIYSTIQNSDSDFDFMEITTLASEIWRTVDYKWPLISTAMGLYLVYSIVKMAIEVGVRMFKLIILQILAPIAIITIISGGMQAKVWSNYINTLWKTFLDIFIRVGSLFLVTAFISKFYSSRSELFKADSFTGFLVLLIVIIAGYRLAMLLPAWLDSIFGSKLAENNKGFGKFLGGVAGGLFGATSGLAAGLSNRAGFLGTMGNMFGGAGSGAMNGAKGKNVADFFKNAGATRTANNQRASNIARTGGGLAYGVSKAEGFLGIPQHNQAAAGVYDDSNKALDAMMKARSDAITNTEFKASDASSGLTRTLAAGAPSIKFGGDRSSFASKAASMDSGVLAKKAAYDSAKTSGNATAIASAEAAYLTEVDKAESEWKKEYDYAQFNNSAVNSDSAVRETTRVYDKHAKASGASSSSSIASSGNINNTVITSRNNNAARSARIQSRGASRRANRTGIYGGK